MKYFLRLNSIVFLLTSLFLPGAAFSLQDPGKAAQDSTLVEKPLPISVNRLVTEIEELRSLIDLNEQKIIPGNRLKRIDSLYPVYKEMIADEESKTREFLISNPNQQKINNLIRRWEEFRVQLSGWEEEITSYVERNLRLVEVLHSESEVWDLTLERAREEEVPEELLSNVSGVIRELDIIEKQTREYNNNYLRLQTRISRLRQSVEESMQMLYDKRESETYDLFHQRHLPLWQRFREQKPEVKESVSRPETLTDPDIRVSELIQTHKEKLFFLGILCLALSAFIIYLRRHLARFVGKDKAGSKTSASYLLFKAPAVVVAFILIFVGRLQLLEGTRFLGDILLIILLLLAIALIIHQIPARYRGLIYFSILFITLDSIKTYVWFQSIHYRVYMLGEAFLMAGVLFYFLRPYMETRKQMTTPVGRFMIRLLPVAYLLCAVSVVSNVLGYTNLADLTLRIVTQSGIAVIIAYALFIAFQSVFISWLEQRFHRSAEPDLAKLGFLKKRTSQFLRFVVILLFVIGFLNIIDQFRNVMDFLDSVLTEPYVVGNLTFTLGSIFMFLLILILSYVASRIISFIVSDDYGLLHFLRLPEGVPTAISLVLRYSIIGFGVVLSLSYLNVDLSKFNLMAGALGLGIGFGLQTVISNFVSGLILVFERPILPGDTIEVNNLFGKVSRIGVRASSITTYDGAEVVVPNMNLISNDLINWTLSDSIRRVEVLVGTSYSSDPNQVLEILKQCATELDYVIQEREPLALFTEFGESSLNFRLLFWVPFEKGLSAKSDVSIAVYNKFKAAGIEIPFPQRDLHVKSTPESKAGVLPEKPAEPQD